MVQFKGARSGSENTLVTRWFPYWPQRFWSAALNNQLIEDAQALLGGRVDQSGSTRRTALKTALGVGYAAAALPIMA